MTSLIYNTAHKQVTNFSWSRYPKKQFYNGIMKISFSLLMEISSYTSKYNFTAAKWRRFYDEFIKFWILFFIDLLQQICTNIACSILGISINVCDNAISWIYCLLWP